MSDYRQLLLLCLKALSTYDAKSTDNHLETFFDCPDNRLSEEADRTFVNEVCAGCVRYQSLINVVVDRFYATDGSTCLRSESNLYSVLSYLTMFRLEELGMGHFKRLVNTQHRGKMHKFLRFLFDEANMKGWFYNEWCKLYNTNFVEVNLISPLTRFNREMNEYIGQLSDKPANRGQTMREGKQFTEPQPFNLTKPTPRSIPTPERIPHLKAYKPVPKSTYNKPPEIQKLAKTFQANRKKAERTLLEADKIQLSCSETNKSEKTKTLVEQIMAEREARQVYIPIKPVPVPHGLKESRPVKLNAAAILREGARIQREEDEEEKKLASLEAGQRDLHDYTKWQEEMKQKKFTEQIAEVERKHLEGQLSYEEAIIAKQTHTMEMRDKVSQLKEQQAEMMKAYFSQREEEQREMRQLVEDTMSGHQNTKEAKSKLQAMKQKIVQQVAKESQELIARALEEAEAEMRRKMDLISQIRAIESVSVIRTKIVDHTETGGQGLLSEMSVIELRERLSLMKIAEAEEAERKRKEILSSKQAKEQLLNDTLETISRFKSEQNKQATMRQEQQKQMFQKHHSDLRDMKLFELQEKLEAKRRDRQQRKQQDPSTVAGGASSSSKSAPRRPHPQETTANHFATNTCTRVKGTTVKRLNSVDEVSLGNQSALSALLRTTTSKQPAVS